MKNPACWCDELTSGRCAYCAILAPTLPPYRDNNEGMVVGTSNQYLVFRELERIAATLERIEKLMERNG